jgi:hypothetical protein
VPVQLVAEGLELVAGSDVHAMAEVARSDARGAFLQHPDRRDHAPGEEHAGQDGQAEAENEMMMLRTIGACQGSVGFGERPFDHHDPPEGRDRWRERRGSVLPADPRRRLPRPGRPAAPSRGPLTCREAREVPVLSNQADVGVREQPAPGVDDVGVAATARLDLSDGPLDGLEADLGRGDLDRILPDRDRQREIGLRAAPEVHRAPVRLSDLVSRNFGVCEKSSWLPAASRASRATRICSFPDTSRWLSSLIAGTSAEKAQEVELALLGQAPLRARPGRRAFRDRAGRPPVVGRSLRDLPHPPLDVRANSSILAAVATCGGALLPDDRPPSSAGTRSRARRGWRP